MVRFFTDIGDLRSAGAVVSQEFPFDTVFTVITKQKTNTVV